MVTQACQKAKYTKIFNKHKLIAEATTQRQRELRSKNDGALQESVSVTEVGIAHPRHASMTRAATTDCNVITGAARTHYTAWSDGEAGMGGDSVNTEQSSGMSVERIHPIHYRLYSTVK